MRLNSISEKLLEILKKYMKNGLDFITIIFRVQCQNSKHTEEKPCHGIPVTFHGSGSL